MTTKTISKTELKRKFNKFLSDNNAITEFNRNFSHKGQTATRKSWCGYANKSTYFSKMDPTNLLNTAFDWEASPQDNSFWSRLNEDWYGIATGYKIRG